MSGYGFEIVQTLIVDIEPDAQVKRAMNEINAGKTQFFACIFIPNICVLRFIYFYLKCYRYYRCIVFRVLSVDSMRP